MIVILGESASGKSTLQDMLIKNDKNYQKIITYTTRPMRDGEQSNVNYHFITNSAYEELAERDFFVEQNSYRGWNYGTARCDCRNAANKVAVLTPAGLRALRREGIETTSIYLYVDRRSRLIKNLMRGDDIEEAYRRNLSDAGQFDGVENEVDYIIDNTNYHMSPEETLSCLKRILKVAGAGKQ